MSLLPQPDDDERYWRDVYHAELATWTPALDEVAARHALGPQSWTRVAMGRNVVFAAPALIAKLGPPIWPGDMRREAITLGLVSGKVPLATPALVAVGELDGWEYVVEARLPGTPLWQLWVDLPPAARIDLARQHGQLMRAIHAVDVSAAPDDVRQFPWDVVIPEQVAECAATMRSVGVDPALVAQADAYLAATPWQLDGASAVLLHGDLNHLNFLVAPRGAGWELTGVIDWGDMKIGPASHELISPGVHMYLGNAAELAAWYGGYDLAPARRTPEYEHLVMARAIAWYADMLPELLGRVPGAAAARDWPAIARCFWHLSDPF